jgi:hypothetical protein
MKNVFVAKDAYIDNTVRVNYWEKDRVIKRKTLEFNNETKKLETKEVEEIKDSLLFCERLGWENEEAEIDQLIEKNRLNYLEKINK